MTHPAQRIAGLSAPPYARKEAKPMAKPAKPIQVPRAMSFSRGDAETALVLLEESDAGGRFIDALDVAHALAICARNIKRECEAACNGFSDGRGNWSEALEQESAKREERAKARALALLDQNFPGISLSMGGDPRGSCFYIKTPKSGKHNTWGGAESGWSVG